MHSGTLNVDTNLERGNDNEGERGSPFRTILTAQRNRDITRAGQGQSAEPLRKSKASSQLSTTQTNFMKPVRPDADSESPQQVVSKPVTLVHAIQAEAEQNALHPESKAKVPEEPAKDPPSVIATPGDFKKFLAEQLRGVKEAQHRQYKLASNDVSEDGKQERTEHNNSPTQSRKSKPY